jgi:two-component system, NarL family, response regulator NreC
VNARAAKARRAEAVVTPDGGGGPAAGGPPARTDGERPRQTYREAMPSHVQLAAAAADTSPQPTPAIRVVLGDDHTLVRRGLRLLLGRERGVEIVAEAGDIADAVRHVHGHRPHVLVLDLTLPNGSSVEAIGRLRRQAPDTQIVVLAMEDDPAYAQQVFDAGAIGYVLKEAADEDLPVAVRKAVRGERFISRHVSALMGAMRAAGEQDALSPREVEVLRLIAFGHTSAEIAGKLHLSPRTVETHRARIHRKLGLTTRAQLVRYALRRGLCAS